MTLSVVSLFWWGDCLSLHFKWLLLLSHQGTEKLRWVCLTSLSCSLPSSPLAYSFPLWISEDFSPYFPFWLSSSHGSLQKHHVQFPISLFLLFKVRTLTIKRITLECEQCHVRSFMSQSLDKLIHILGRGIESAISFFTQVILHLVICREPPF